MDIDFIWKPGEKLKQCIPKDMQFNWAVSSHVLEHVPNPIGWINNVLDTLVIGGLFSLALPDKRYCYDKFRVLTDVPIMIDHWLREQSIPSPYQLYDFLSRSVDGSGEVGERAFDTSEVFSEAKRFYTDEEALNFTISSWTTGVYYDAHCSVFTPESFVSIINEIVRLGIMSVEVSQPILGHEEFFVTLKKIGDPKIPHPGGAFYIDAEKISELQMRLKHAEDAFDEAVLVQNKLKSYNLKYMIGKILRRN